MKPAIVSGVVVTLLTLTVLAASGPRGIQQEEAKKLYVIVGQSVPSSVHGDITEFTTRLLQLQLSELNQLKVEPLKVDPCAAQEGGSRVRAEQRESQGASAGSQSFYLIRIEIDVSREIKQSAGVQQKPARDPEMVLDYELFRYDDRCTRVSLVHSAEPFPERSVMSYLTTMADVVLLKLEDDLAPKRATVGVTIVNATSRTAEAGARIKDYIESSLMQTNEFVLSQSQTPNQDPADYTIKAEVSGPNNRTTVRFTLIARDGGSYTSRPISGPMNRMGPANEWSDFYRKAAASAINLLEDVRYAADLKLSGPLSRERATALLDKVNELMCTKADSTDFCQRQPQAAIPLLTELTDKKKNDPALSGQLPTLLQLLGEAQLLMEEYAKAAAAFESAAAASVGKPADIIQFSNKAGDAWYLAKNYQSAIARYETSLQTSEANKNSLPEALQTQYGIHLQISKSYRFNEERLKALTVLLDSLEKLPPSGNQRPGIADLEDETRSLVDDIRPTEVAQALTILEKKKDIKFVGNLLNLLSGFSERAARNWLALARQFRSQSKFPSMDETLKQIESLPASSLTPATAADLLTVRAIWLRDNKEKKDFARSEQLLQQAIQIDDSRTNRLELAETYYLLGKQNNSPKEARDNYDKAADILTKLVKDNYAPAYWRFRIVNHLRDKDEHSKDLFKALVDKDAQDLAAANGLRYVYQYMGRFDKALEITRMLEQSDPYRNTGSFSLEIAETYLLNGLAVDVERRLTSTLQKYRLSDDNRAVLHFYQMWAALSQNKIDEARQANAEWRKTVETVRKGDQSNPWLFYAAKSLLKKDDTIAAQRKTMLVAMIEAMEDNTKPLPAFTP